MKFKFLTLKTGLQLNLQSNYKFCLVLFSFLNWIKPKKQPSWWANILQQFKNMLFNKIYLLISGLIVKILHDANIYMFITKFVQI